MFVILNVETGDFYSESPSLKNKAKRSGERWNYSSAFLAFARRYTSFQDALRSSQKISNSTGKVCAVVHLP